MAVPWDTVADTPDTATITPDSTTGDPTLDVADTPSINTVSFGNTTVPKAVVASTPVGNTSAVPVVVTEPIDELVQLQQLELLMYYQQV